MMFEHANISSKAARIFSVIYGPLVASLLVVTLSKPGKPNVVPATA
jgi:hypothetical protein